MKVRLLVVAGMLTLAGCGPAATVKGRVTCQGKPVKGSILFSPKGEGEGNRGPAVSAQINDGTFALHLTTIGKHTVVVSPSDIKYPVKPDELDYPCDRTPTEWDVKAGANVIEIKMESPAP